VKKPAQPGHTAKHPPGGKTTGKHHAAAHHRGKHPSGTGKSAAHKHYPAVRGKKTTTPIVLSHPSHPKQQPGGKVRKLALGSAVACCAAEALAASLRMAGQPVADEDVLALYWQTASGPDAGASILATLEAAEQYGLAGCRPRPRPATSLRHGLVVGTMLPGGPHAVTLQDAGFWSWGELYELELPVIEEAWEVRWL
jgi:hypothetical protein